jgi:predicted metalloprotease with PDZ domain
VALERATAHEIDVAMQVPALPARSHVDLLMPVWAPGSYMVRDFSRHVFDFEARDGRGRRLPVERVDKQRWRVRAAGLAFQIRYRVFAFDQTVRTSAFDDRHAYWNGTSVFLYVDGETARPCEVTVRAPRGWHVSTALPSTRGGRYAARSYDELVDSPFEVGTHAVHAFSVGGTRFELALTGSTNADVRRLLAILRAIVTATGDIFGGFPFARFLFIVHMLPARGGGLEHRASTTLDVAGFGFDDERAYLRFAELAAHEFFHCWNVKRIRDVLLGPFDYTSEAFTRLLWFHEGFTEYMEGPILLRAELLTRARYLEELADEWPRYATRPGRNVTPLDELSIEAWIKQYKPAENFTNRAVSYYEKGKWAALVLELLLREATRGRRGIVDLFQRLWRRFGRRDQGLGAADIEAAARELCARGPAGARRAVAAFFGRYVRGVEELPVPRLLARAGVRVVRKPAWARESDAVKARRLRAWSGLDFASARGGDADGASVRNVLPDSPAFRAGLTYGDEVVAVDGSRVTASTAGKRLADRPPGSRLRVTYFRKDTLREATLVVGRNPEVSWSFKLETRPTSRARAVRRGWLGG